MKITVSQLNAFVKDMLYAEPALHDICVQGELSGVKIHSSGHIYFTLKDESAAIRCAFFKPHSLRVGFRPKDGMKVACTGRVTLYERDGQYQLNVTEMVEDGVGDLYIKFEALKKKLLAEGLFDEKYKKKIPAYPKKIGVVTSPTGAAVRDIIKVATEKCPGISIVLAPVTVQGADAPRSICMGISALDNISDVEVIIVGRGGGSMEDLWCFNDEQVARTVFNCKKPVISAVGHETDFTIIDFVADLRAATPTDAADKAVFDLYDLNIRIDSYCAELLYSLEKQLSDEQRKLQLLSEHFTDPQFIVDSFTQRLQQLSLRLVNAAAVTEKERSLGVLAGKLDALSPLKVLERGYAIVTDQGSKTVISSKKVNKGDFISVKLYDGSLTAEVK